MVVEVVVVGVVVEGTIVELDVVEVVGAVVVVVVVGEPGPGWKSGVIQYSDSAYERFGNTGVGEYAYRPFCAAGADAGAVMHPVGDTTERFSKPCNVYAYAPFG